MQKMRTLKPHRFGNKQLTAPDELEATEHEAKVLRALGRAENVGGTYERRDLTAAQPRVKRAYRRRDMQAQPQ